MQQPKRTQKPYPNPRIYPAPGAPKQSTNEDSNITKPAFPMRINKFLALRKDSTRRGADEIIKEKKVFINGRLAVLGDKVQESDKVEIRFRGKAGSMPIHSKSKPIAKSHPSTPQYRSYQRKNRG
jgi:ribosomal 50S subunit-recycling heat shock protein